MATLHIEDIRAMARLAHSDGTYREGLFASMLGDDRTEAVHAAWALTHLPKSDLVWLAGHRSELVDIAVSTADTSLRRLSLALLERLAWPANGHVNGGADSEPPEYYTLLLDFCFTHMMLATEPYGVRSLCMKLAYKLSLPYPELLGELRQNLLLLEPSDLGPGVRHTRNKILNNKN